MLMISIVTICLNSACNIRKTLNSVSLQINQNYEHIVKDGLSTDGTIAILNQFQHSKMKYFSYPDQGIYNAFNQSLDHVSGQYVSFLNAGDYYVDENVLSKVESRIKETGCDLVYGNLNVVKKQSNTEVVSRKWRAGQFNKSNLKFGWMPPHPTLFVKKSLFHRVGNFNEDFSISGDYDWVLRVLNLNELNVQYIDQSLVNMEAGGASQSLFTKSFVEDAVIGFHRGNLLLPILKRLSKIHQFKLLKKELL